MPQKRKGARTASAKNKKTVVAAVPTAPTKRTHGFERHWGYAFILVITALFGLLLVILMNSFLFPEDLGNPVNYRASSGNTKFVDEDLNFSFGYPSSLSVLNDKDRVLYLDNQPLAIANDGTIDAPFTIRVETSKPEDVVKSFAAKKYTEGTTDLDGVKATTLVGKDETIVVAPYDAIVGSVVITLATDSPAHTEAAQTIFNSFAFELQKQ